MAPDTLVVTALASMGLMVFQTQRVPVSVTYAGPPNDVRSMVEQSDLVVVARNQATTSQRVKGSGMDAYPYVLHDFKVLAVVKGTSKPNQVIHVEQLGGVATTAGIERFVDDRDFRVMAKNQTYVLFLKRSGRSDLHDGAFYTGWGPGGVFLMRDERVDIPPSVRRNVSEFQQKPDMAMKDLLVMLKQR